MKKKAGRIYARYIAEVDKLITEIDFTTLYQKFNGGLMQCHYCRAKATEMYRNSQHKLECPQCRENILKGQYAVNENGRFWTFK